MKKAIKFWGTRGSCAVSGPEYLHYGGNTTCVEVRYDDALLVIDAGTGIRPLGITLAKEKKIDLFLTHMHWDHLIGLPFFDPLFLEGVEITIWAPRGPFRSCKELLADMLSPEFFPVDLGHMRSQIEFKTLEERKPFKIGPLTLECHATRHPGLTYCFKIITPHETIGYVSDNEINLEAQESFINFHRGCDIFVHEAQYSPKEYVHKTGWGHSSINETIALVKEIRPKKWLVTHHDPKHTDNDLKTLEKIASESAIPCPAIWIPDMYELKLM